MGIVTIISDASFCDKTLAAGYGCFIASDHGKFYRGGQIRQATCNNTAEAMGACNGLWHAMSSGVITQGDTIIMQVDCDTAIRWFKQYQKTSTDLQFKAVKYLLDIKNNYSLQVYFKHIKAHTNNKDARSVVQDKCDKLARMHMRKLRDELCGELHMTGARRKRGSNYLRLRAK